MRSPLGAGCSVPALPRSAIPYRGTTVTTASAQCPCPDELRRSLRRPRSRLMTPDRLAIGQPEYSAAIGVATPHRTRTSCSRRMPARAHRRRVRRQLSRLPLRPRPRPSSPAPSSSSPPRRRPRTRRLAPDQAQAPVRAAAPRLRPTEHLDRRECLVSQVLGVSRRGFRRSDSHDGVCAPPNRPSSQHPEQRSTYRRWWIDLKQTKES